MHAIDGQISLLYHSGPLWLLHAACHAIALPSVLDSNSCIRPSLPVPSPESLCFYPALSCSSAHMQSPLSLRSSKPSRSKSISRKRLSLCARSRHAAFIAETTIAQAQAKYSEKFSLERIWSVVFNDNRHSCSAHWIVYKDTSGSSGHKLVQSSTKRYFERKSALEDLLGTLSYSNVELPEVKVKSSDKCDGTCEAPLDGVNQSTDDTFRGMTFL